MTSSRGIRQGGSLRKAFDHKRNSSADGKMFSIAAHNLAVVLTPE